MAKASDTCSPALEGNQLCALIDAYINHKISGGKLYYSYSVFVTKGEHQQGGRLDDLLQPERGRQVHGAATAHACGQPADVGK